jgi:hypothetical protein
MHSELNFDFSAIITVSSTHSKKRNKTVSNGASTPKPMTQLPLDSPLTPGAPARFAPGWADHRKNNNSARSAENFCALLTLGSAQCGSAHLRFKTQVSKHAMKLTRCFSKTPKNAQIKVWRKSYRLDGSSAVYDAYRPMFQFQLIQLQKNCEMPACQ